MKRDGMNVGKDKREEDGNRRDETLGVGT